MSILLDCTLRDGGYYTNWHFDEKLVRRYILCMAEAGVDYVEVGMRRPNHEDPRVGVYADIDDEQIRRIADQRLKFSVMLDAKDFSGDVFGVSTQLDSMFVPEKDSPVWLVRIATSARDLPTGRILADLLKNRGYTVALNLMRVTLLDPEHLGAIVRGIQSWATVDVLYLADSFGSLTPDLTEQILQLVRRDWDGAIGVHMHDNRGLALANTLAASGEAQWIDSTMLGMGRGAGNARTEILIQELEPGNRRHMADPLLSLLDDFSALQARHRWGPSPFYALSARLSVHPTYVQELVARKVSPPIIVAILRLLQHRSGHTYDAPRLKDLLDTCTLLASPK